MTTIETYTGQQLLELATKSAGDDPVWLADAVTTFNRILNRGASIAVYENHDLGHPEMGLRKYAGYGLPAETLPGEEPPERLPDTARDINWRYTLIGVCTAGPVPEPPPITEILGVPMDRHPVLLHYTSALDNHEPTRRFAYGPIVRYTAHDGDPAWKLIYDPEEFKEAHDRAVFAVDDGQSVTITYVSGGSAPAEDTPDHERHLFLSPFPVNPDGRTRPDDGRLIDYGNWMLGPHKCYHLKVSQS